MIAGIGDTFRLRGFDCPGGRQTRRGQRLLGDLELCGRRPAGQLLDRASVGVAGRKIHCGKGAICAQALVDEANALEPLGPVDIGDQPHAGDDIAHGDVGCPAAALLVLHRPVDGLPLESEALFQPSKRRRLFRILVSQPLCELRGEGCGQGRGRARQDVGFER